jgi:histidinol-phosphate aminotransferase
MSPALAELLHRIRQPFNVNVLAQVAATAALKDAAFLQKTLQLVHTELDAIYAALDNLGVPYVRSEANFFMVDVGSCGHSADDIFKRLLPLGVIVRPMTSYGYPRHIRVNIGIREENMRFLEALEQVIQ